jgi:hypothetical protein
MTWQSATDTMICSDISIPSTKVTGLDTNYFKQGGNDFGATATLGTTGNNDLNLITNNTTKMTVLANGSVGIGTTNPTAKLVVRDSTADSGATETKIKTSFNDGTHASNAFLRSWVNGTTATTSLGSDLLGDVISFSNVNGNVGIGTTSPTNTLTLRSSAAVSGGVKFESSTGAVSDRMVIFPEGDYSTTFKKLNPSAVIAFQNSTGGEEFRLSNNGNIGIGTTAPSVSLDLGTKTDAVRLPAGTTAQQPITPANGMIRYNSDNNKFEAYENGAWTNMIGGTASSATSVAAGAGSAAAPSISFSGDSNTGFYSSGTDSIGISAGGAKIWDISASGIVSPTTGGAKISTAAGTAAAPTFSFAGDTDTGWYLAAPDTLAASTGGLERVRIDASGNVGIGTSGPNTALTIGSSGANGLNLAPDTSATVNSGRIFLSTSGTSYAIGANVNGFNLFYGSILGSSSGTAAMTIANTGKVGIGTTNPSAKLEVMGSTMITRSTTNPGNYVEISPNDANTQLAIRGMTQENLKKSLRFDSLHDGTGSPAGSLGFQWRIGAATSPTTVMTINESGNVGIGTVSPLALLDVHSGGSWTSAGKANYAQAVIGGAEGVLQVIGNDQGNHDSSLVLSGGDSKHWVMSHRGPAQNNRLSFGYQTSVAGSSLDSSIEMMTITNSGNVGIGTAVPASALDVSGSANIKSDLTVAGNVLRGGVSTPSVASSNITPMIQSHGVTATSGASIGLFSWTSNGKNPGLYFARSDSGVLQSHSIVQSGELLGGIEFAGSDGTAFLPAAGIAVYVDGAPAVSSVPGAIAFRTAAAGGATTTERMRISSSGNVGIGTTNPTYGLQVYGTTGLTSGISLQRAQSTGLGSGIDFKRAIDTSGTSTAQTVNGSGLGQINFFGTTDTGSFSDYNSARIRAIATEPTTVTANGGALLFDITANNSTTPTEAMRIDNTGNVGIGTTNPWAKLTVNGGIGMQLATTTDPNGVGYGTDEFNYTNASGTFKVNHYGMTVAKLPTSAATYISGHGEIALFTAGQNRLHIKGDGNVGIGTTNPTALLHVNGVALATAWNTSSDVRLKEHITEIENPLDKILQLRGVEFVWRSDVGAPTKHDQTHDIGVIAQEVEKVFPEAVTSPKDGGFKSVAYSKLIAPVIGAIQELYHHVMDLEGRSRDQNREVASLKNKVHSLEEKLLHVEEKRNLQDREIKALAATLCEISPKTDLCRK